jgi:hypothetical protein
VRDPRRRWNIAHAERVLFIGTQFSILYTSMYSPAKAATRDSEMYPYTEGYPTPCPGICTVPYVFPSPAFLARLLCLKDMTRSSGAGCVQSFSRFSHYLMAVAVEGRRQRGAFVVWFPSFRMEWK